jgi:hypothetical protein
MARAPRGGLGAIRLAVPALAAAETPERGELEVVVEVAGRAEQTPDLVVLAEGRGAHRLGRGRARGASGAERSQGAGRALAIRRDEETRVRRRRRLGARAPERSRRGGERGLADGDDAGDAARRRFGPIAREAKCGEVARQTKMAAVMNRRRRVLGAMREQSSHSSSSNGAS